jgi:nucleoside-triphosphatase THEP1
MELLCPNFFPAVVAALDNPSVIVLGSVPVPRYGHAIPQVEALKSRVDVQVVAVNRANRDALVEELSRRVAAEILALVHAA